MKPVLAIVGGVAAIAVIAFAVFMVDVDQTQEAALPDVDIDVEGGQLPEFDAEVGSISVGETDVKVEVPDVEITTNTETVTVPTLNIEAPEDDTATN
ncbi:hypothetical protein MWU61_14545 [Loktanella sp. F6476L]|uniref:hypothetical protein n=1 Tax=Loktanella sp. F6476L TaxID=2926405 RepID=UPI001FF40043|nr:hypothetical protein [Loktanella sp. F6476L]MCK0121768.1 hypothetical protein [Loktanella sp. F6476L]